jgi:putative membrane protein insertion efficiency factor
MSKSSVANLNLAQHALLGLLRGYRLLLSPWVGSACRFEPTCSLYAMGAVEQHGAIKGTYLLLHRLGRCNPLCEGGHDPVPPASPIRLFTQLVSHPSDEKSS